MQGVVRSLPKALEGEEGKEPHRSVHEGLDWKWFFVNAFWGRRDDVGLQGDLKFALRWEKKGPAGAVLCDIYWQAVPALK